MSTRLAHAPVLTDGRQIVEIGALGDGDRDEGAPVDLTPADAEEVREEGGRRRLLRCKVSDGATVEDVFLSGNSVVTVEWRDEAIGQINAGHLAPGWLAQEAGHVLVRTVTPNLRNEALRNVDDRYPRHVRRTFAWSGLGGQGGRGGRGGRGG